MESKVGHNFLDVELVPTSIRQESLQWGVDYFFVITIDIVVETS